MGTEEDERASEQPLLLPAKRLQARLRLQHEGHFLIWAWRRLLPPPWGSLLGVGLGHASPRAAETGQDGTRPSSARV